MFATEHGTVCLEKSSSPRIRRRMAAAATLLAIPAVLIAAQPWSAWAQDNTEQAPARPTGLTGTIKHDQVSLTWDNPEDETITGYQVLRRDIPEQGPGEFSVLVEDTGTADTAHTDATVEAGNRYVYRIKARNGNALSPQSNYFNADVPEPPVPSAPTGLTGTIKHDGVSLTWDDPEDDTITGYQVLRRDKAVHEAGDFQVHVDDTGSADNSYTDTDVEYDAQYVYRIKARNEAGLSPQSGYFDANVPQPPRVTASFEASAYTVAEGSSVTVAVILDKDPERDISIRIVPVNQGGAADTDYSGVPGEISFGKGDTRKEFTVTATADPEDAGESVALSFGPLPERVSAGTTAQTTVSITDQPPADLVSNMGRNFTRTVRAYSSTNWAIRFTTGDADHTWRLTGIKLQIGSWPDGVTPTVTLHQGGTGDQPGDLIATLANPGRGTGRRTFDAPPGTMLQTNTTYAIALSSNSEDEDNAVAFRATNKDSEDDGGAIGWDLANDSLHLSSGTWGTSHVAIKVSVQGIAPCPPTPHGSPATGAPVISGTAQVGETLTADTSGIADEDGTTKAVFTYQWARVQNGNSSNIPGATNSAYTLTRTDQGKSITVTVSFTDDADNQESVKSRAEGPVSPRPLTAEFHTLPESHDGETAFNILITFSERLKNRRLGHKVVRITNGANTASTRAGEDPETWQVTIEPDGDGDLTIALAASDACGSGLACTTDYRPLSKAISHIVTHEPRNSPATGKPAISGTPRIGEVLTADTTDIADEDGLDNVSYSYQWTSDNSDIEGATEKTYRALYDDAQKALRVRVTFTDDEGNSESLTSDPTAPVTTTNPCQNHKKSGTTLEGIAVKFYGSLRNKTSLCVLPTPQGAAYDDAGIASITPANAGRIVAMHFLNNDTLIAEFQCDTDFSGDATITATVDGPGETTFQGGNTFTCQ